MNMVRIMFLLSCMVFFHTACNTADPNDQIIKEVLFINNHTSRDQMLFQNLSEIKKKEKISIKIEDEVGILYQISSSPDWSAEINYYRNLEDTTSKAVALSIYLNFNQEKTTTQTYKLFESYFKKRYGVYDGNFGNQEWLLIEQNLRLNLKLLPNAKQILITYAVIS